MKLLKVTRKFDAAHRLTNYKGACNNLHGHTWKVIVTFKIIGLQHNGISEDFKDVKKLIDKCLPDHEYLNERYKEPNPTAEKLVEFIFNQISILNRLKNLELKSVELFETEDNSVIYHGGL